MTRSHRQLPLMKALVIRKRRRTPYRFSKLFSIMVSLLYTSISKT
jgi:hypothetical protein